LTDSGYLGAPATMRRLVLALAASACGHAAVLANAPLSPDSRSLSLIGSSANLHVRIAPAPPSLADAAPPPVRDAAQAVAPTQAGAVDGAEQAPAAGLPAPEIYYRGKELDERAEPMNTVNVAYPEFALSLRMPGKVTLRLAIDHRGELREASVVDADPPEIFNAAALQAVRALKFRPAMRQGRPVGSIKVIEVPFEPDCNRTRRCED
jgi:TonB family protein